MHADWPCQQPMRDGMTGFHTNQHCSDRAQSTCKERMVAHVIGSQELPRAEVQERCRKCSGQGGEYPAPPPVLVSLQVCKEIQLAETSDKG